MLGARDVYFKCLKAGVESIGLNLTGRESALPSFCVDQLLDMASPIFWICASLLPLPQLFVIDFQVEESIDQMTVQG